MTPKITLPGAGTTTGPDSFQASSTLTRSEKFATRSRWSVAVLCRSTSPAYPTKRGTAPRPAQIRKVQNGLKVIQRIGISALPTECVGSRVVEDGCYAEREGIRTEEHIGFNLRRPEHQCETQHDATHETPPCKWRSPSSVCAPIGHCETVALRGPVGFSGDEIPDGFLLRRAAMTPSSPVPRRTMLAGSGTAVSWSCSALAPTLTEP